MRSHAQKQLFHLRARELELALDRADKQITKAGKAVLPFARDPRSPVRLAPAKVSLLDH